MGKTSVFFQIEKPCSLRHFDRKKQVDGYGAWSLLKLFFLTKASVSSCEADPGRGECPVAIPDRGPVRFVGEARAAVGAGGVATRIWHGLSAFGV